MRLSRIVGVAVLMAVYTSAAPPVQAQTGFVINSINLQNVNFNPVTGLLTATGGTVTGTLAGLPFTSNITNFTLQATPGNGGKCSVLDLALGPIDIALLGLHVDTTPICLTINAFRGQGLLGDLLCGLAGGNLGLLGSQDLLTGLESILNGALGRTRNAAGGQGVPGGAVCTGECEVLDVVLGPLNLSLLGVVVHLDNCSKGPVEICVSATESEGLLGSLLCSLAGGGLSLQDILSLIEGILSSLP